MTRTDVKPSMGKIRKEILELVPEGGVEILQDIFLLTKSAEIGIPVSPYRAKHSKQRDVIDKVKQNFLVEEHDNKQQKQVYRLKRLALPILGMDKSERILRHMEELLSYLNQAWHEKQDHIVTLQEVHQAIFGDPNEVTQAMLYLKDIPGFSGGILDFPNSENTGVFVSEPVIDVESIAAIFSQDMAYARRPITTGIHFSHIFDVDDVRIGFMDVAQDAELRGWIADLPTPMPEIIKEIEAALSDSLLILACLGLRALLDQACLKKTDVHSGFKDSVNELMSRKLIDEADKRYLLTAYEFGSSVMHRGNVPTKDDVGKVMTITVTLLHRLYVVDDSAKALQRATPPRGGNQKE